MRKLDIGTLWIRRALLGSTLAFASISVYGCLAEPLPDDSPFQDTVGSEAETAEEISESDEAALGSEEETVEEISESDEAALGSEEESEDVATASSELASSHAHRCRPSRGQCWLGGDCNGYCKKTCHAKRGVCKGWRRTCTCRY
jgi:hypothetical protein